MAAFVAEGYSLLNLIICLLLLSVADTTEENVTGYDSNSGVSGDHNLTHMDSFTTLQPELDSTTPTHSYSRTEDPVQYDRYTPLPFSGRLLSPVTDVGRLCPCDGQWDLCDINCCCDRDCSEEAALFTGCSVHSVGGNQQLCSRDAVYYSLGSTTRGLSELHSSVHKEINYDIFCIQSQNRVDGLSYASPPLPTDSNVDSLFNQFSNFIFGSENSGKLSTAEQKPSYLYGDVMVTVGEDGERDMLRMPVPAVTAYCLDTNPAAFLKKQMSRCSRRVVLNQDCSTLPSLSMVTYTDIQLLTGKSKDAEAVAVVVASVIQQSLDGTQTEVELSGREDLKPVLLRPSLCANVVLEVGYVVKYNPSGEITNVTASLVLGSVRGDTLTLEQQFHITFVQEGSEEVAVHYSGNPGYVVGLPLVSGRRTVDGIARSSDPRETLTTLQGAEEQDCLHTPHQRSPVLFGMDSVSGCTLRLEDAANCSLVSQVLLDVLRGLNYPQYVAAFGSSPLQNPLDWVPIKNYSKPTDAHQSCSIPLALHLEIEWTKYGTLVNPQAQIVSVKEVIHTNSSNLASLSGGSSVLSVSSSVTFIPVSAAALPGFRASPTLDAKLPFHFFFPFV